MKRFINGQAFEQGFNYGGMLNFAVKVKHTDSLDKLEKLAYSFCAVNYHTLGTYLDKAVNKLKAGNNDIQADIKQFKADIKAELELGKKCDKFTILEVNKLQLVYYDESYLCQYMEASRKLQQFSGNAGHLFDVELMKFFVIHYLGEEVKSTETRSTGTSQQILEVNF